MEHVIIDWLQEQLGPDGDLRRVNQDGALDTHVSRLARELALRLAPRPSSTGLVQPPPVRLHRDDADGIRQHMDDIKRLVSAHASDLAEIQEQLGDALEQLTRARQDQTTDNRRARAALLALLTD